MILLTAHSLTPRGRFEVETCGLTLEERNSQIQFTLPVGEAELTTGDWIRDDTDPGAGIVYRIRTVETNYQTRTVSCTAEHIIQTLRDTAIFGEVTPEDMGGTETSVSALNAIKNAINRQSDWVLNEQGFGYGSVSAGYSFNGDSVYEAIETVCSTLEDCWWSYDVSVYPFVLTIAHKGTTATCEMRGGRNISSIRRTVDRSRMYTRIYPIGKENLHITGNYLSKNTNIYGVICKVETDQSIESEDHLRMWAQGRLNRHCEPSVNISINGLELSQETGEPLDHLTVGTVCRVPLPEFGTTLNETITKLQWRDKIKEPENVSVTLANEMEDVASIIRQEQSSGSGTTGKAGRAGAKKAGEDHAWFVDTDDHVSMVAEAIAGTDGQGKPNWSRVSTLTVDGNGIDSRVTTTEGDMVTAQSRIKQSETAINMTVGTYNNFTLVKKAKKSDFPATGAANTLYLDQSSGKYYVWIAGKYADADVTTDDQGNPVSASYVKAGEIAIAINDSGDAEAHIDAKKIILGKSTLTSGDLDTWAYGAETGSGVFAQYMTVETLTAQSVTTKKLDASFAITGQLSVDGQADFAQGVIVGDEDGLGYINVVGPVYATDFIVNGDDDYAGTLNVVDAEVDSTTGELKIWKVGDSANEPSITFSKATTLSDGWSGGGHVLTITASPQNETFKVAFDARAQTANKYMEVAIAEVTVDSANYLSIPINVNSIVYGSGQDDDTITTRYTKQWIKDVSGLLEQRTGVSGQGAKITANGTYTPTMTNDEKYIGIGRAVVDVHPSLSGSWTGSVLTVTANPSASSGHGFDLGFATYGTHKHDLEVTIGGVGTKDATVANSVSVPIKVQKLNGSGSQPTEIYTKNITCSVASLLEAKTGSSKITSNGTYSPSDGKLGFSSVVVEVDSGAERGSRINGYTQDSGTTSNVLTAYDTVYKLQSQYKNASGGWSNGETYLVKTPASSGPSRNAKIPTSNVARITDASGISSTQIQLDIRGEQWYKITPQYIGPAGSYVDAGDDGALYFKTPTVTLVHANNPPSTWTNGGTLQAGKKVYIQYQHADGQTKNHPTYWTVPDTAAGITPEAHTNSMGITQAVARKDPWGNREYYGKMYFYDAQNNRYVPSDNDHYWYYSSVNLSGSSTLWY